MARRTIGQVVDALLACACEGLQAAGRPACACYATVGPPVVGLCCECEQPGVTGELTINFEDMYPADQQTLARVTRIYPCRPGGTRAADVTLVLSRCYPTVDETGNMPDPAEVQHAADELHEDVETLWRAITCCGETRMLWRGLAVDSDPEGGCSMIAARVTVEV